MPKPSSQDSKTFFKNLLIKEVSNCLTKHVLTLSFTNVADLGERRKCGPDERFIGPQLLAGICFRICQHQIRHSISTAGLGNSPTWEAMCIRGGNFCTIGPKPFPIDQFPTNPQIKLKRFQKFYKALHKLSIIHVCIFMFKDSFCIQRRCVLLVIQSNSIKLALKSQIQLLIKRKNKNF